MEPGIYTFYNQAACRYLSFRDRTLTLSSTPLFWDIKHSGKNGFHVSAHHTDLFLDIDNAWVRIGNPVKVWTYTGHPVQLWSIAENPDGTYTILHSADPRYCLGFDGEHGVLQLRDQHEPMQRWKIVNVSSRLPREYLSVFGRQQVVELQLPTDIEQTISKVRLQHWANQLEIAYGSFEELTGFRPFSHITVEAYKPSPYEGFAGWVFPDRNIIFVDCNFLHRDLEKMNYRRSDWNFCVLHEMGHLFDGQKPWNFESELMTDLKVAYVMEVNHAAAAPAEFPAVTIFYGADIAQAYARLSRDFSREYDIFGCVKRFLEIKDQIGWTPFRDTFHDLQKNCANYTNASARERLDAFVRTLSRFSGQNIRTWFSAGEWDSICRKISQ